MADILLVDDQDRYAELLARALPEHRYRGPARDAESAVEMLVAARGRVELVLLDVHFDIPADRLVGGEPGERTEREVERLRRRQGVEILRVLRQRFPALPVILMTSRDEVDLEAIGADDYTYFLADDMVDAQALRAQIDGVLALLADAAADGPVYWGPSLAMRRLRQRLMVLARGRLPVLLLGETGTGKSLIARQWLHARSGRVGRFVAVDVSTLPPDLVAAHLFGSVKGAYTGSVADRPGAFEAAHGGTLFIDEIGNLSPDAQKMLLAVLQDGVVTRVGDVREREVDVKLVVATNESLSEKVEAGAFRADLYMRLNPATAITLPPLRERSPDWDALVGFCLAQALARPQLTEMVADYAETAGLGARRVRGHVGAGVPAAEPRVLWVVFPERSVRRLRQHAWPGNLRELSMVIENAALFALAEAVGVPAGERPDVILVRSRWLGELLAPAGAARIGTSMRVEIRPHDTLNKVAVDVEEQYFTELYIAHQGDFAAMAQVLLGDPEGGRKVQLRFNQLGLKVRELRERVR